MAFGVFLAGVFLAALLGVAFFAALLGVAFLLLAAFLVATVFFTCQTAEEQDSTAKCKRRQW